MFPFSDLNIQIYAIINNPVRERAKLLFRITVSLLILWRVIVPNLKITPSENFNSTIQYETENAKQNAINKFKNLPSIKMIK